ncbi:MAG: hypothetical protein J5760_01590 [Clostridia bacterium]|nr:hypothetical protein [Clostridia bacterium]
MNGTIWDRVYGYIDANPGDIQTVSRKIWFSAYAESGNVYIESATSHAMSSRITTRRKLDKKNAEIVYELYKSGAKSQTAREFTRNYAYWRAIFAKAEIWVLSI